LQPFVQQENDLLMEEKAEDETEGQEEEERRGGGGERSAVSSFSLYRFIRLRVKDVVSERSSPNHHPF
jgi:hypothetical protein